MVDWANESTSKFQTNRLPLKIAWHGFIWDYQTNRLVSFVELWVGCECGATRETIKHVIYECPLLREDRQIAIEAVGHRWRDLSYILGGWNPWEDPRTGRPVDGPKEKWKANLPVVKAVLHFLHKSGRFAWQTRAVE